jgi:hypothetical protein
VSMIGSLSGLWGIMNRTINIQQAPSRILLVCRKDASYNDWLTDINRKDYDPTTLWSRREQPCFDAEVSNRRFVACFSPKEGPIQLALANVGGVAQAPERTQPWRRPE